MKVTQDEPGELAMLPGRVDPATAESPHPIGTCPLRRGHGRLMK